MGRPVRRSNRRFERFNVGLITKRFIERTEPDSSPVDGWTGPTGRSGPIGRSGPTGRSGPIFKTMKLIQTPLYFIYLQDGKQIILVYGIIMIYMV